MLRDLEDLHGYALRAADGEVGSVKDFYFDDERWVVRYFIVDTGNWLASRKVLISPISIGSPDTEQKVFPVSITREQVKNSPAIDTDKPVSRQHEVDYLGYYGYPAYWDTVGIWGVGEMPEAAISGGGALGVDPELAIRDEAQHRNDDPHLRSCKEVTGYHIKAQDGEFGHVRGWIVDEQTWAIRYLVIDTGHWLMGHKVLVSPQSIHEVSWSDRVVVVNLTRNAVEAAPSWNPDALKDAAQWGHVYRHDDRTGYW